MSSYDHKKIERKWQKRWAEDRLYETRDSAEGKENLYALVEFIYTSGDAHMGHWYAFSVPDIYVRMKRMQGFNVLYPMGFDSFGLPAENAAIKHGVNPAEWTQKNIDRARTQIQSMGGAFDWSREVITCDPNYYKWTQWIFLQLFKNNLAYRAKGLVNWCPKDQTVLADEQVIDGKCERCGTSVEQRDMSQWFFKIKQYADRLVDDLDALDWPEPIKLAQKNWIGRSQGAEITFTVQFEGGQQEGKIPVFTTRPDTLYGATFMALAPEHLWMTLATDDSHDVLKNKDEAKKYIAEAKKKTEIERTTEAREKTGVKLEGVWAVNPATKEKIPLFVADYVLAQYGTGAVMGVPAHDERDNEFAEKYKLPVVEVIEGAEEWGAPYSGDGNLINSGQFNGMGSPSARKAITEFVGGKMTTTYKVHDWSVSRQRYWGTPIPIVYDPEGNPHAIPDEHLPWLLPTDADIKPKGISPLGSSQELKNRTEKIFGKGWTPEVDTMDGFVDNSWHFLRYLDPKNDAEFASKEKQQKWMPVDRYSGGAEHTTVHVLYSRFLVKALYDLGITTVNEPYKVRMNRGIILAEDGRKMSKRWGNVINPDDEVARVGADAVRTYFAFIGPYNEVGSYPWNTNGLIGVRRFLERIAGFSEQISENALSENLVPLLNQTIKKVRDDIEAMKFNTSVSALMIFSNELQKLPSIPRDAYEILLTLLAPFAPHLTEELWQKLGHSTSIHTKAWPVPDPSKLEMDEATIAVQVAGKTKGILQVPRGSKEGQVHALVFKDPKLQAIVPQKPSRVIFVANKIINFVP